MASDSSDVDKLLGQIKLKDFSYRSFGRNEPKTLRIVRSAALEPVAEAGPVPPPPPAAPVTTAAAAAAPAPPVVTASIRVNEAFERLARVRMTATAPRLSLRLDLPPRPSMVGSSDLQPAPERTWHAVFDRLNSAALPPASLSQTATRS